MHILLRPSSLLALILLSTACANAGSSGAPGPSKPGPSKQTPDDAAVAVFASGCFWCVESIYESVDGVYEAVSGYAGGSEPNPSYEEVAYGRTTHAEAVKVYYDPDLVDYATLVDVFFNSQNPTQVDGQGPDRGRQYRSIIFYSTPQERQIAESKKAALDASGAYDRPIAADIEPAGRFWVAEDYHQDYEVRNPNNPYIRGVSVPRLERFQAKMPEVLKETDGSEH